MKQHALLGQHLPPRGALDQPHAKALLQVGKPLAHYSQRQIEFPRRGGQTPRRHDTRKGDQVGQVIDHRSGHSSRSGEDASSWMPYFIDKRQASLSPWSSGASNADPPSAMS
jgi:hypothetical protein